MRIDAAGAVLIEEGAGARQVGRTLGEELGVVAQDAVRFDLEHRQLVDAAVGAALTADQAAAVALGQLGDSIIDLAVQGIDTWVFEGCSHGDWLRWPDGSVNWWAGWPVSLLERPSVLVYGISILVGTPTPGSGAGLGADQTSAEDSVKLATLTMTLGLAGAVALMGCDDESTTGGEGAGGTTSGTGGTTSGTGGGTGGTTSGTGGTTSGTGGSTGGEGGSTSGGGGAGGQACVDPVPGVPTVTSATPVSYTAEITSGVYTLIFNEDVTNADTSLTWAGAGTMDGVTVVDAQTYDVAFSGMAPSDASTLTVATTVEDTCGNTLAAEVVIDINIAAGCLLLGEDFEGNYQGAGWSTVDNISSGNLWATDDTFGSYGNMTNGTGLAVMANSDYVCSTNWDSELHAPMVSLANLTNLALSYQSDFQDYYGGGDAWLDASSDGTTWTTLTNWTEDHGPTLETLDLSAYAGGNLYLRWRYVDDTGCDWYWAIDDVCLQEFTPVTCPCPTGAYTETTDTNGTSDGNGTLGTAEATSGTLTNATDSVAVCGLLEDEVTSGTDYFLFDVAGAATDAYVVTVSYCFEELFTDAVVEIRDGSDVVVASTPAAAGQGSFSVILPGLASYYVVLSEGVTAYPGTTYSVTAAVDAVYATALWSEGFEAWPPTTMTVVNNSPGAWAQSTGTVNPSGGTPTEGANLAYFNSFTATNNSTASLETTTALNFTTVTVALLTFDMYHDTSYPSDLDRVQVEYDSGNGWTAIGPAFLRPGDATGWSMETVDLTSLAGQASVLIRFLATSDYGNDVHIDNVRLLTP